MTASAPSSPSSRWLHGPVPDLLFGSGLLYLTVVAVLAVFGPQIRAVQPTYFLPLLVLLVSMPHYGGTLVRVYETRTDRRAYTIFSTWVTLLLFALFVVGVHMPLVGALLLTVYLTWSPWHYTAQNYGITVMFLRRRGVPVEEGGVKRWLYASFVLSYALVFCVFHGSGGGATSYDRFAQQASVVFLPLGIPSGLMQVLFPLVVTAYAVATAVALTLLLRRARLRDALPSLLLVVSQAMWFSLPFAVVFWQLRTGLEPIDAQLRIRDYILWVALAHSAQYLWVTSYYARATSSWHGGALYAAKVAAAGIAIWSLPVIIFAPDVLGNSPYDAGLSLVLAATINLHHFVLDGAIWKLRHTRIGNVLIRSGREDSAAQGSTPRNRSLRPVAWALCAVGAAAGFVGFIEMDMRFDRLLARGDRVGASASLDRAAWLGRDSAERRRTVARHFYGAGEIEPAIANYQRSVELAPDAEHLGELGFIQQQSGDLAGAMASYRDGLALAPDHHALLLFLGRAEIEAGELEAAVQTLERLATLKPDDPESAQALEEARAAAAAAG